MARIRSTITAALSWCVASGSKWPAIDEMKSREARAELVEVCRDDPDALDVDHR